MPILVLLPPNPQFFHKSAALYGNKDEIPFYWDTLYMYTVGLYCIRYLALRCSWGNDAIRVVSVAMFSCTWCSGVVHILYNARRVGTGRDFVILCYNTGRGYLSHCYVTHFA